MFRPREGLAAPRGTPRNRARPAALLVALLVACSDGTERPGAPGSTPARSLLLISIDTLRADHLGLHGYPHPTSPSLDAFARGATVFERAYATSSWTLPSVASMLTSLHPSTHEVVAPNTALPDTVETLAERLLASDFRTGAVTSHVFLARKYAFDQGFDDYDTQLVEATARESHQAITSEKISDKGIAWLEARAREGAGGRWFLWLHYFDPHASYQEHAGITERFGTKLIDRYDGEIAYTDAHIGRVLAALDRLGLADETVVVVVADHGEEFGDHGNHGHHRTLFEEVLHVPLVVRAPGFAPGRCATPVSGVDIVPTVCELLGVAPPPGAQGHSLVPALRGEPFRRPAVVAELGGRADRNARSAIFDDEWKLIQRRRDGLLSLYDRRRDPGDLEDLAERRPEEARRLARELADLLERYATAEEAATSLELELSPEELETLDQLGYGGDD